MFILLSSQGICEREKILTMGIPFKCVYLGVCGEACTNWFIPNQNVSPHVPRSSYSGSSLVTQMIKNLPAMKETQVQSLGEEDPLEKEMATHSSILAWEILWTGEPGELQSTGLQKVGHRWVTNTFTYKTLILWGIVLGTQSREG